MLQEIDRERRGFGDAVIPQALISSQATRYLSQEDSSKAGPSKAVSIHQAAVMVFVEDVSKILQYCVHWLEFIYTSLLIW